MRYRIWLRGYYCAVTDCLPLLGCKHIPVLSKMHHTPIVIVRIHAATLWGHSTCASQASKGTAQNTVRPFRIHAYVPGHQPTLYKLQPSYILWCQCCLMLKYLSGFVTSKQPLHATLHCCCFLLYRRTPLTPFQCPFSASRTGAMKDSYQCAQPIEQQFCTKLSQPTVQKVPGVSKLPTLLSSNPQLRGVQSTEAGGRDWGLHGW